MTIEISNFLLSTIGSAALVSALLWLTRNLLITRLKKAVSHEYDKKLTIINSDLSSKISEIESLRDGILGGVANRQRLLYERRLNAVEQLWNNILDLAPAKKTSATILAIPYEKVLEYAENDPKVQEMFQMIDAGTKGNKDLSFFNLDKAANARPFLSELAWALFSAYSTILSMAVLRMEMIKIGVKIPLQKPDFSLNIVKKALPHQTDYIDKYGLNGLHYLLEELELSILKELRRILDGKEADKESLEMANSINEEIKNLYKSESVQ